MKDSMYANEVVPAAVNGAPLQCSPTDHGAAAAATAQETRTDSLAGGGAVAGAGVVSSGRPRGCGCKWWIVIAAAAVVVLVARS